MNRIGKGFSGRTALRSAAAVVVLGGASLVPLAFAPASPRASVDDELVVTASPLLDIPGAERVRLQRLAARFAEVDAGKRTLREILAEDPEAFALFCEYADDPTRHDVVSGLPFGPEICDAAKIEGVDPLLVASVVEVESTFRPTVGSHKGAVGLMQLLPSTAGLPRQQLLDPETNLEAGSKYLAHLIERYDGNLELALAAYNAGPTNVRRYDGVPPFAETEQYVEKVLTLYAKHSRAAWERQHGPDVLAMLG